MPCSHSAASRGGELQRVSRCGRVGFVYLLVRVIHAGGGADQGDEKAPCRVLLVESMGTGGSGVLWLELEHGLIPVGPGGGSEVWG